MVTDGPAEVLHDRRIEREALVGLLAAVRGGQSRVLVVCGEAGVGKTALLEYAIGSASGFRVVRAVGVESEMELAFAALQQLCAPILDRLDRLPAPQRDALGVAFGLRAGDAPDRFLVGLAVLSLLAEVAEERPLVCVVDDAQWLDRASAQALVFVARRLLAESVALLLVTREPGEELRDCRSWRLRVWVMVTRAPCWARRCGSRWMSGCGSGSSRRRAGTRWRCWSCRGG